MLTVTLVDAEIYVLKVERHNLFIYELIYFGTIFHFFRSVVCVCVIGYHIVVDVVVVQLSYSLLFIWHCQNAFQNMLLSHMNLWPLINLFAFNVCIAYETHRKHRKDHTILFIYSSVFFFHSLSSRFGSLFFLYISCMAFFSQLPLRCLDFSTRCLRTS